MMKKLKKFKLTPTEHQERSTAHIEAGKKIAESVKSYDFTTLKEINYVVKNHPEVVIAGKDQKENETLFGPVDTIAKGGCIIYVGTMILRNYGHNIDVITLANEAVKKGYRSWGFKKYMSQYFITPTIDIKEIKEKFSKEITEVGNCETVEELEEILGKVTGIGGSAFLVDNIISLLSDEKLRPVLDTRITTMEQALENLKNGILVPMRVNNTIYHNDTKRVGGHNIILAGISNGEAILLDSSLGINKIPAERLFKAAIANEGLISVWDLSNI